MDNIDGRKGQVMVEYVIVLVFAAVIVLALFLLYTGASERGGRMIDSVTWSIP